MSTIVLKLSDKTAAHRIVFASEKRIMAARPFAVVAETIADLREAVIATRAGSGAREVAVKSARGTGGDGVFFVNVDEFLAASDAETSDVLVARGYNTPRIAPPFLVEARIESQASPTVDVYVHGPCDVSLCGVYAQRLYDRRYYAGFYMPSHERLMRIDWMERVLELSEIVGHSVGEFGYQGFLNIDFVIDAGSRPYLVEINPRRSALLDGLGFARHLLGTISTVEISMAEYVESRRLVGVADAYGLDSIGDRRGEAVVVPTLDAGFESEYKWLGLVALSSVDSERALTHAMEELGCLDGQHPREVVGEPELVQPGSRQARPS